jgi:hypothetical protein
MGCLLTLLHSPRSHRPLAAPSPAAGSFIQLFASSGNTVKSPVARLINITLQPPRLASPPGPSPSFPHPPGELSRKLQDFLRRRLAISFILEFFRLGSHDRPALPCPFVISLGDNRSDRRSVATSNFSPLINLASSTPLTEIQ